MMDKETLDGERHEILEVLSQLMQEHPRWRIGQIVANIAFLARESESATWDVEDAEFVQAAQQHLRRVVARREDAVQAKRELQETRAGRQKVAA